MPLFVEAGRDATRRFLGPSDLALRETQGTPLPPTATTVVRKANAVMNKERGAGVL